MPVIKGIPCHTPSSRRSVMYAAGEDNPKVVARDYINCSPLDSTGRNVWQQFDGLREERGLNRPRMRARLDPEGSPVLDGAGRPAMYDSTVYYEHYIISPDPRDEPTLEQVRAVATEWVQKAFGDFQAVIGYHDDTGIVHAHVLVNSPNVMDGSRITDATRGRGWGRKAWRSLQDIARSHGLSGFLDEVSARTQALGRDAEGGDALGGPHRAHAASAPREPSAAEARSKAVESLYSSGRYSWVEDIRCRLEVAALISRDVGQFRGECGRLGVEVARTADGRDWKYAMARQPSRQVTGRRLGGAWTEFGVGRRLARDRARGVPKPQGASLEALEAALEALVGSGGRQVRLLRAEERREVQEAEWVLVRGARSLLRGAARPLPGDPFGGAAAGDCAAGALARLRAAGWPAEGERPLEAPGEGPVEGAVGGTDESAPPDSGAAGAPAAARVPGKEPGRGRSM